MNTINKKNTELIIKLDSVNISDINNFISLIQSTNVIVTKIGLDEFSITIKS